MLGWLQHRRDLAKPLPLLCACFPGFTFGRGIIWTLFRGCGNIGVGLLFLPIMGLLRNGKSGWRVVF